MMATVDRVQPLPKGTPWLVFGGSQVWLVHAANETEAGERFRADFAGRHKGVLAIQPNEIRIRPLRLQDEPWLLAALDGPSNQAKEFVDALAILRKAVK